MKTSIFYILSIVFLLIGINHMVCLGIGIFFFGIGIGASMTNSVWSDMVNEIRIMENLKNGRNENKL